MTTTVLPHSTHIGVAAAEARSVDEGGTWRVPMGHELVPDLLAWELLGTGPRCETWMCWSPTRGVPVVVKLPRADMQQHPRSLAAVRREVGVMQHVSHPGVVRLLASDTDAPLPYLVTEYVDGENLAVLVTDEGPMEPEDAGLFVLQLAAAVHYVHELGFAHLDLKPGNLSLRDGRPVLLDFGAAQPLGSPSPEGPRGTDGYMSPEQIRLATIDRSMDVYGLGAVLHELVSGRRPTARRRRMRGRQGLGLELLDLAWRLRAPSPQQRPSSAAGVIEALDALLPEDLGRPWPPELAASIAHRPTLVATAS